MQAAEFVQHQIAPVTEKYADDLGVQVSINV